MLILAIACLGALINKIRGGLIADLYYKYLIKDGYEPVAAIVISEDFWKPSAKHFNCFMFAIVFTPFFGLINIAQSLFCFALLYAGMLGGSSWGWGAYINAMIDGKVDFDRTDAPIADNVFFYLIKKPVLAGWAALSVRGFMWTICISSSLVILESIGINTPSAGFLIAPVGLLMGSCYLISMEICQRIPFMIRGNGWQIGEYVFGAVLWGSLAYFLGA
jgi:hypothetical protein